MNELIARIQATWATRDQGATAVEYGLMVALIAVVIVLAVATLGSTLSGLFTSTESGIDGVA
ncbi:MAG TPA: Flp family type IVb pilin [Micromonosporaceae bacterium]|nr:Flp family type IVb pilin [Micromonosporaceae bacterium]